MIKIIIALKLSMTITILFSQNLNLEWVSQISGTWDVSPISIVTDNSGNIYNVGHFTEKISFELVNDIKNLTSMGQEDIYIQKLDPNGKSLWLKHIKSPNQIGAYNIVFDPSGFIYITGGVNGETYIEKEILVSKGNKDFFILKMDLNGKMVWVKQIKGVDYKGVNSIVLGSNSDIYLTGSFQGKVDFDPGPDTLYLSSIAKSDIFIQKLDLDGNLIWIKKISGMDEDSGNSITLDSRDNIIVTGNFWGKVDFDPSLDTFYLTPAGDDDIFILKLTAEGDFLWSKKIGGKSSDWGISIESDINDDLYLSGVFYDSVDFDFGLDTYHLIAYPNRSSFILKADNDGNMIWVKQMNQSFNDLNMTINHNKNIYFFGSFRGTVDFDPGIDTVNMTSRKFSDAFIKKLDSLGNLIWVKQMPSTSFTNSYSIALNNKDSSLYIAGSFYDTMDLDPSEKIEDFVAKGRYDGYISKISENQIINNIQNKLSISTLKVFPNPCKRFLSFDSKEKKINQVYIYDQLGKKITSYKLLRPSSVVFDHSTKPGIYFIKVYSEKSIKTNFFLLK